jgi:hypothetical protein
MSKEEAIEYLKSKAIFVAEGVDMMQLIFPQGPDWSEKKTVIILDYPYAEELDNVYLSSYPKWMVREVRDGHEDGHEEVQEADKEGSEEGGGRSKEGRVREL